MDPSSPPFVPNTSTMNVSNVNTSNMSVSNATSSLLNSTNLSNNSNLSSTTTTFQTYPTNALANNPISNPNNSTSNLGNFSNPNSPLMHSSSLTTNDSFAIVSNLNKYVMLRIKLCLFVCFRIGSFLLTFLDDFVLFFLFIRSHFLELVQKVDIYIYI